MRVPLTRPSWFSGIHETASFLIAGGIFVAMGIASSMFERLPCSTAMFYLAAGFVLGPAGVVLPLVPLALAVVTASVLVHGISATPLMNWYQRLRGVAR